MDVEMETNSEMNKLKGLQKRRREWKTERREEERITNERLEIVKEGSGIERKDSSEGRKWDIEKRQ